MSLQRRKVMLPKFVLLTVFCVLLPVCALRAQYRFDQWTEENGLPQNWIKGIRQTRDGYLWLTTGQGAARFDGVRFKIFNRANTPTLFSDRFSLYAILEDSAGNLWMGTEDGGVTVYRDGVFTAITSAQGLPGDTVVRIDEDAEGAIWIFTTTGLARWKDRNLTKIAPAPDSPFNEFLTAPQNFGGEAKYFGLWRRDDDGWDRFAHGKWETFPLPTDVKDPAQMQVNSFVEDALGRIWYSLRDRPGEFYRVENKSLTTLSDLNAAENIIFEDRQGRLWLNDRNGSLAFVKNNLITTLTALPKLDFNRVLEDREGTIWITTISRGLYRINKQVVTVYLHPGGRPYNNIQPLMQDRSGNIWVGSGGLARFDNGRFENFYHEGLSRSPLFERNVLISLFEDTDGSFWLGVRDGIARFRDGRLVRDEELSAQIKGWTHAIHRDRTGGLWFGSEEGLYCLRDGKVTRYGTENGLPSPHARVIFEDHAGTLWIGTVGGLARRTENGFYSLNEADGVTPARISSLHEDSAGFLWAGTYDGVLYRIKKDSGKTQVVRYATDQGLPYNAIHKILEDDYGFFWIGGQRGIYRIRRQELDDIAAGKPIFVTAVRLGKDDGLLTPSCNSWGQPAGFKARDGKLWFPTEEGIAVIDPKNLPFNSTPPPVLIEEALLDREPVAFESGLQINPDQGNLEINYSALSFIKPEQIRFKYKLEGFDNDWVEVGSRRTAYYSHLPPGNYIFRVIAANSDNVWNEGGATLEIVVLPSFYRTWWFVTLAALGAAGMIFLVYKHRVSQLRQAQIAQQAFARQLIESQESERKRIAAELHDSLGQNLLVIKNRALLSALTLTDGQSRTQFSEFSNAVSQTLEEVRTISHDLRPPHLDQLGLRTALVAMIEKVAVSSTIQFTHRLDELDGLLPPGDEITLYRIVQECLNNILKHSGATAAEVDIAARGGELALTVHDNGRGFTADRDTHRRAGIGLQGIAERVRIMGGTHVIHSVPGQGTTVTVKIELKDE